MKLELKPSTPFTEVITDLHLILHKCQFMNLINLILICPKYLIK